jgi:hypothetical protein
MIYSFTFPGDKEGHARQTKRATVERRRGPWTADVTIASRPH